MEQLKQTAQLMLIQNLTPIRYTTTLRSPSSPCRKTLIFATNVSRKFTKKNWKNSDKRSEKFSKGGERSSLVLKPTLFLDIAAVGTTANDIIPDLRATTTQEDFHTRKRFIAKEQ